MARVYHGRYVKLKFKIEKGHGQLIGNFLRQCLLTRVDVWRPIAFTIGNSSNVVTSGDNILEDSSEIANNICRYHYEIETNSDIYKLVCTTKELKVSDLNNGSVKVIDLDAYENASIFHALNQEVTMTIFFRKAKGKMSSQQNQAALQREGINPDNIVVFNSRHSNIDAVSVIVSEYDEMKDTVEIELTETCGINSESLIQTCCKDISDIFTNLV